MVTLHIYRRQEKKTVTGENEKNSLFRVQGADDVQNLVDALATWREPRTSDRAHGPPTLISPQSFLNSTLKCAEVKKKVNRNNQMCQCYGINRIAYRLNNELFAS
jgi:hypothetical protein